MCFMNVCVCMWVSEHLNVFSPLPLLAILPLPTTTSLSPFSMRLSASEAEGQPGLYVCIMPGHWGPPPALCASLQDLGPLTYRSLHVGACGPRRNGWRPTLRAAMSCNVVLFVHGGLWRRTEALPTVLGLGRMKNTKAHVWMKRLLERIRKASGGL